MASMLTRNYLGKADEVQSSNAQQAVYDALKDSAVPLGPKEIEELTGLKLNYWDSTIDSPLLTQSGHSQ